MKKHNLAFIMCSLAEENDAVTLLKVFVYFTFPKSSISLAFIGGKVGIYALLVLYVRRIIPLLGCNKRKSMDVRVTRSLHQQSRPLPGRYKRKSRDLCYTRSLFCETGTEPLKAPLRLVPYSKERRLPGNF
jgi:hypothetical protein